MGDENRSKDEGSYSTIKVPDRGDTYLESMSGNEEESKEPKNTTCNICGLTARTKEELQDHVSSAHKQMRIGE